MAAFSDDVGILADTWVQLTAGDVTALRVQNRGGHSILLKATVGAVQPVSRAGSVELAPGAILAADLTLAQLWPGVAGANRVYAFGYASGQASVSHA